MESPQPRVTYLQSSNAVTRCHHMHVYTGRRLRGGKVTPHATSQIMALPASNTQHFLLITILRNKQPVVPVAWRRVRPRHATLYQLLASSNSEPTAHSLGEKMCYIHRDDDTVSCAGQVERYAYCTWNLSSQSLQTSLAEPLSRVASGASRIINTSIASGV